MLPKVKELVIQNEYSNIQNYFTFKGLPISICLYNISLCGNHLSSVELSTVANNLLFTVSSIFSLS